MSTSNVNVEMERATTEWMQKMEDMRTEFMAELKTVKDELAQTKDTLAQTQTKPDPNEEHERLFNDRVNGRVWTPPVDWEEERIAVVHTVGYNQRACV